MLSPDFIFLDITMPLLNGIEAASKIATCGLRCRILVFTMHQSERLYADVREIGAHGYIQKSHAGRDLVSAMDALCQVVPSSALPSTPLAETAGIR